MSNTATHPAIMNAKGFGEMALAATGAKAQAAATLEGWTSAKLLCAVQFAHDCAKDADTLALACDVSNAFTIAAGGKALGGDSLKSQGRKFTAWGRVGARVPAVLATIGSIVDNLAAAANAKGADKDAKQRHKSATTRVFEKGTTIMRRVAAGDVLNSEDIVGVLTEREAPSLAAQLATAHKALAAAAAMVEGIAGHDWRDYVAELEAAAAAQLAHEKAEKQAAEAAASAEAAAARAAIARTAREAAKAANVANVATLPPAPVATASLPRDEINPLEAFLTEAA